MAKLNTVKTGKYTTAKTVEIGDLYQVGLNGHGGSERLAKSDRMSLHFRNEDGSINNTVWLDRDETVMLIKRAMNNNSPLFADLFELAAKSDY